jgi:hypothetical protein
MDSGGTTNFRQYAQATSYGFQFSNGTWLNDNISSIAGGGFSQNASTPDFVSPAEADWALCTPDKTRYAECADFKTDPFNGAPSPIEAFGGTSQSTPLDAGVAALVIEAYRNTHGGRTPSPLLVKQIMQSTANDLGFPNQEQGAGEVDGLKAVQEAMSVDGGTPTGHGLLFNPAKLTITGQAGWSARMPGRSHRSCPTPSRTSRSARRRRSSTSSATRGRTSRRLSACRPTPTGSSYSTPGPGRTHASA